VIVFNVNINQMNNMVSLETTKKSIESMSKYHQVEILKLLVNNNCKLNENKSGVFINLSFISENVIMELNKYIKYTQDQELYLITTEYQKEEFKSSLV
jgi:hypothetical protein